MMNHPTLDKWTDYLYGELELKEQSVLTAHLRACSDCRSTVSVLRGSMYALDQWELPEKNRTVVGMPFRAAKWGIAAMLVLGVGFGFGRFTAPSAPDVASLRAELENSLRSSLKTAIREEVRLALDARLKGTTLTELASLRGDLERDLQAYVDRRGRKSQAAVLAASKAEAGKLVRNAVQDLRTERQQEHQAYVAALRSLNAQRLADFRDLREDMDTLVVLTDDELQRTKGVVGRWLAYTQPGREETPTNRDSTEERKQE